MGRFAAMLEDAEPDILAFYAFPAAHWTKLRSTNPLERFNKEIGRRTGVVGILPNDAALVRLTGMLCIEQDDEWLVGRAYLSAEHSHTASRDLTDAGRVERRMAVRPSTTPSLLVRRRRSVFPASPGAQAAEGQGPNAAGDGPIASGLTRA